MSVLILILWRFSLLPASLEARMTYINEPQSRQMRKAQARRAAKHYVARMKVRLNSGGRSTVNSPKAIKVIERGTAHLFVTRGRPFVTQLSHIEASAFLGDEVDQHSRYAMAFAVDRNGNPYSTLPVAAFRQADHEGPALTAQELAERAEQAAFGLLFNMEQGLWPHRPVPVGPGQL